MSTTRPPDDDEDGNHEPYRLSDEPPAPRPMPRVEPDEDLLTPADGLDRPRRRRRKRKRDEEEGEFDAEDALPTQAPEPGDRILNRKEESTPKDWWVVPAAIGGVGGVLCLIPLAYLGYKSGAAFGVVMAVLAVFAIVVQVVAVSGFLMVVGTFFGIDYGPATHALVKLAAIVTLVNGLSGAAIPVSPGCLPCGVIVAGLVGAGLFQYLFRLAIYETLLTLSGVVVASWALNALILRVLMK
jgi:hypothetical protein